MSGRLLSCGLGALAFAYLAAWPVPEAASVAPAGAASDVVASPDFLLDDGRDLRTLAGPGVRGLLEPVRGRGARFGPRQRERYCRLKQETDRLQWVVEDLATGEILSKSPGAERLFFGASASKIFVAGAVLEKAGGRLDREQLDLLIRMIVVSDNGAWRALQRQAGPDGSDDGGRAAVQAFTRRRGYPTIQGFQGWMRRPDGSRVHGNELNAVEVSRFLRDTYLRRYAGADVLWKVMQATRTGASKIDKYTPADVYIAGKTGTYSGSNESPATVKLPAIHARNHAASVLIGGRQYGITILCNTGDSEDVAVLGGGLQREFLGVEPTVVCR